MDGAPEREWESRECWLSNAKIVSGDWGLTLHGVGSHCKIEVRLEREHADMALTLHGVGLNCNIEVRAPATTLKSYFREHIQRRH